MILACHGVQVVVPIHQHVERFTTVHINGVEIGAAGVKDFDAEEITDKYASITIHGNALRAREFTGLIAVTGAIFFAASLVNVFSLW